MVSDKIDNTVPQALRIWFIIHFVADFLFAIPLMVAPVYFLGLMGWHAIDPFTARLVAAALFGIGIESLLARNANRSAFRAMLNLKIIWSLTAIIGIALSIAQGAQGRPVFGWIVLLIFIGFHLLWAYWRFRLKRHPSN